MVDVISAAAMESSSSSSSASSSVPPSSSQEETWPEVAAAMTERARRDGVLESVRRADGLPEKVRRAQEGPGVRRRLASWVSRRCSWEARHAKSGAAASRLRDEGNAKFAARDDRGALR